MIFFATFINALSYVCSITSFASYNFLILLFVRGFNHRREKMSLAVFTFALVNCLFWFSYGLSSNLSMVLIANAIGLIAITIMLSVYSVLYAEKRLVSSLIYNIILLSSIGEVYYIVDSIIGNFGINILGFSSVVVSIIKDISFCVYINQAMKRRDEGHQLYYSMISNSINCLLWIGYYLLVSNKTIVVSYLIELSFSLYMLYKLANYVRNDQGLIDAKPIQASASVAFSKSELIIIQEKEQP